MIGSKNILLTNILVIPASKDLTESSREVIAVSVHKVVPVPTIFLAQLFKDLLHLLLGEVGVAEV